MEKHHGPKHYVFYLYPEGHESHQRPLVYFSMIVSSNIDLAVRKFSVLYHAAYSGMLKVSEHKYQVFFIKGTKTAAEELMYIVIEDEKPLNVL